MCVEERLNQLRYGEDEDISTATQEDLKEYFEDPSKLFQYFYEPGWSVFGAAWRPKEIIGISEEECDRIAELTITKKIDDIVTNEPYIYSEVLLQWQYEINSYKQSKIGHLDGKDNMKEQNF